MAIQYPLINGVRYDFSSIEIDFNGKKFLGFTKIAYSDSLEPGKPRGAHPQAVGRTRGEYDCEASAEMFRQEFDELATALGDGYGEVPVTITVGYSATGQPTITDVLSGVRIKKVSNEHSQSTDALAVSLELDPQLITRNGKTLLKNPRR